MGSLTEPKLLVVDFTKESLKPGSTAWAEACTDIKHALEQHGCFVALYDKVSPKLHNAIFNAADELFDLPIETKVQNINEKPYHGYVGQMSYVPLHEGLGIDYATTPEGAQSFTQLMWPNGNDSFWYIVSMNQFCQICSFGLHTLPFYSNNVLNRIFEQKSHILDLKCKLL